MSSKPWMQTMVDSLALNWSATHISILIFMVSGIIINGGAIIFLFRRNSNTMFHKLLKILAISDLIVDITCGILWGIPTGYNYYSKNIFPRIVPYLIPLSHMAVMVSNFCTGIMGFERFVRFNFLCKFRYRSWISQHNFRYYCIFILVFPVLFYAPKFFELSSEEKTYDCRNVMADSRLIKLVYVSLVHPDLMANLTRKSGSAEVLSQSVVETVVKCVEAASNGISNVTYFKIGATALRKNQYYYRIYFVGANTVFGHILPFALLVIINVLIVRVLNAKPKPNDIIVASNTTPTETTTMQIIRKSTIEVTTSVRRKVFITRRTSSVISATCTNNNNARMKKNRKTSGVVKNLIPTPLSPSVFGLDSENISFIDSPASAAVAEMRIETNEVDSVINGDFVANGTVKVNASTNDDVTGGDTHLTVNDIISNNNLLNANDGLRRNRSQRGDSVFSHAHSSTVTVTVFVNDDDDVDVRYDAESVERRSQNLNENLNIERRQMSTSANHDTSSDTPRLVRHGGFRTGFRSRQPNAQEARLTRISLCIICLYLVCHIWKLIPTFYEAFTGDVDNPLPAWPDWLDTIKNLSHVLVVFNSAVNFLLYLIL